MARPNIGPAHDTAFFNDMEEVFDRHPEAAKNYAIRYFGQDATTLKVDFDNKVAVTNLQTGQLVTRFLDRGEVEKTLEATPTTFCCEWTITGSTMRCTKFCQ